MDGITIKPYYRKEYIDNDTYIDEWGCKRKVTDQFIDIVAESPVKDIKEIKKYKFPDPYALSLIHI